MNELIIAPSILSADFARLGEQVRQAVEAGARYIHVDVMDGHFVPNITIAPLVVKALRPLATELNAVLDAHLMIANPDQYIVDFAEAGADIITVHVEACPHLHRTIQAIHEQGVKAGVTLNTATPLVTLEEILHDVELVLIMSVNPGFGGQSYIPARTDKIRRHRAAWLRDCVGTATPVQAQAYSAQAAMVKMAATENAQRVIDMALQMHGGLGVKLGTKVESLYRDIRALRIYEGATEVQQLIIGKSVLKG